MERFHPICDARSRVSRNITIRAERLARSGSAPGINAEDIKQGLRLHLYRRDKFNPSRGQYDTFADRVLANRIATLAAPTESLRAERAWVDFNTLSEGRGNDERGAAMTKRCRSQKHSLTARRRVPPSRGRQTRSSGWSAMSGGLSRV
jgi:hypothetical protein